ncbi:11104_t:CDS:2 [Cetraspora pellucida]|uniref:11104_t:CDS:1 n=1 Tax=Cetraspora pellucida TaxID=1433469 RepID=A0ACA9PRL8_9GLOM|nr:11104_t:CDS:2 [Cetraspora pellucida]
MGNHIENFLYKVFTDWNIENKLFLVTTDNAVSMIKAIRQLETTHFRCVAYTIYKKDTVLNLTTKSNKILEPISSDTVTHWNSTYLLLQRLIDLHKAISVLAKNLVKDPDRIIRIDENNLKEKIITNEDWQGLIELYDLFYPFACASVYIDEN